MPLTTTRRASPAALPGRSLAREVGLGQWSPLLVLRPRGYQYALNMYWTVHRDGASFAPARR